MDLMDDGTTDFNTFLERLYGNGIPPPGFKIGIELNVIGVVDVVDMDGGEGGEGGTTTLDTFEFLLNTALEGFIRLQLPTDNMPQALSVLQKYFDALSIRIIFNPVGYSMTGHWCTIGFMNGRPRLVKNPFYYSEGSSVYALYGDYSLRFAS